MIHDSIAYLLRIGKVKINFINKKINMDLYVK